MCAMVKSRVLLGMVIPPLIGILIMGIKTPTIGLMTVPYYMENASSDPGTCGEIILYQQLNGSKTQSQNAWEE